MGFGPTKPVGAHWFSKPAPSTTRPSLRNFVLISLAGIMIKSTRIISAFLSDQGRIAKKDYEFDRKDGWGYTASIDLFDCDHSKIRSKEAILEYLTQIMALIKCTPYGPPTIAHIGKGTGMDGWSLTQLILTSSITIHCVDAHATAFIDIFFCDYFDPDSAIKFTNQYFEAKKIKTHLMVRGEHFNDQC